MSGQRLSRAGLGEEVAALSNADQMAPNLLLSMAKSWDIEGFRA